MVSKYVIFYITLIYFLSIIFLSDLFLFSLISVVLAFFSFLNFFYFKRIVIPKFLVYFGCLFSVLLVFLVSFWKSDFDFNDIVAVYLFFLIIPILICSICFNYDNCKDIFNKIIIISYWIVVIIVLLKGFIDGIDFERSEFLSFGICNKNGFAMMFEVLFIYVLFLTEKSTKNLARIVIQIIIGMLCSLIIGSKTSILLVVIFTIYYFLNLSVLSITIFFTCGVSSLYYCYLHGYFLNLNTVYSRFMLWEEVTALTTSDLIVFMFGNGPGTFKSSIKLWDLYLIESPHNYILHILHGYGIVVVSFFIYYFKGVIYTERISFKPAYNSFFIFFLHSFFDVGWTKGSGFLIAFISGILMFYMSSNDNKYLRNYYILKFYT